MAAAANAAAMALASREDKTLAEAMKLLQHWDIIKDTSAPVFTTALTNGESVTPWLLGLFHATQAAPAFVGLCPDPRLALANFQRAPLLAARLADFMAAVALQIPDSVTGPTLAKIRLAATAQLTSALAKATKSLFTLLEVLTAGHDAAHDIFTEPRPAGQAHDAVDDLYQLNSQLGMCSTAGHIACRAAVAATIRHAPEDTPAGQGDWLAAVITASSFQDTGPTNSHVYNEAELVKLAFTRLSDVMQAAQSTAEMAYRAANPGAAWTLRLMKAAARRLEETSTYKATVVSGRRPRDDARAYQAGAPALPRQQGHRDRQHGANHATAAGPAKHRPRGASASAPAYGRGASASAPAYGHPRQPVFTGKCHGCGVAGHRQRDCTLSTPRPQQRKPGARVHMPLANSTGRRGQHKPPTAFMLRANLDDEYSDIPPLVSGSDDESSTDEEGDPNCLYGGHASRMPRKTRLDNSADDLPALIETSSDDDDEGSHFNPCDPVHATTAPAHQFGQLVFVPAIAQHKGPTALMVRIDTQAAFDRMTADGDDILPAVDNMLLDGDDTLLVVDNTLPVVDNTLLVVDNTLPAADNMLLDGDDKLPVADNMLLDGDDILPAVDNMLLDGDDILPAVDNMLLDGDNILPVVDNMLTAVDIEAPVRPFERLTDFAKELPPKQAIPPETFVFGSLADVETCRRRHSTFVQQATRTMRLSIAVDALTNLGSGCDWAPAVSRNIVDITQFVSALQRCNDSVTPMDRTDNTGADFNQSTFTAYCNSRATGTFIDWLSEFQGEAIKPTAAFHYRLSLPTTDTMICEPLTDDTNTIVLEDDLPAPTYVVLPFPHHADDVATIFSLVSTVATSTTHDRYGDNAGERQIARMHSCSRTWDATTGTWVRSKVCTTPGHDYDSDDDEGCGPATEAATKPPPQCTPLPKPPRVPTASSATAFSLQHDINYAAALEDDIDTRLLTVDGGCTYSIVGDLMLLHDIQACSADEKEMYRQKTAAGIFLEPSHRGYLHIDCESTSTIGRTTVTLILECVYSAAAEETLISESVFTREGKHSGWESCKGYNGFYASFVVGRTVHVVEYAMRSNVAHIRGHIVQPTNRAIPSVMCAKETKPPQSTPPVTTRSATVAKPSNAKFRLASLAGAGRAPRIPKHATGTNATRATVLLEKVHLDPVHFTTGSFGGYKKCLVATDEASSYALVIPMADNRPYSAIVGDLRVELNTSPITGPIATDTTRAPTCIQSDNEPLLISKQARGAYAEHGFTLVTSKPNLPQTNHYIESLVGVIRDATRTSLFELQPGAGAVPDKLLHKFWLLAAKFAVYKRNHTPLTRLDGKSPAQMFTGRRMDISTLPTFGRLVIVPRPLDRTHKFAQRKDVAWFVGVDELNGAHLVLMVGTLRLRSVMAVTLIPDQQVTDAYKFGKQTNAGSCVASLPPQLQLASLRLQFGQLPAITTVEPQVMTNPETVAVSDVLLDPPTQVTTPAGPRVDNITDPLVGVDENVHAADTDPVNDPALDDAPVAFKSFSVMGEPNAPTLYAAQKTQDWDTKWVPAIRKEVDGLFAEGNIRLVTAQEHAGHQVLPSDVKLKIKGSADGEGADNPTAIFKARLVAGGHQESHPPSHQVFSPTVMLGHFRLMIADAALRQHDVCLLDFARAYLLATPSKTRFIKLGATVSAVCGLEPGHVYAIANLYGTSDAGRMWWLELCDILTTHGYERSKNDACVWIGTANTITICTYVDDLCITGTRADIDVFTALIAATFSVKIENVTTESPSRFLGANITKLTEGGFTLDQSVYITHMLKEAGMHDCKPAATPLDPSDTVPKAADNEPMLPSAEAKLYGHIGGQIDWIVQFTRPDGSVAASKLAQHVAAPSVNNWQSLKHFLRYLRGSIGYRIKYSPVNTDTLDTDHGVLQGYSDASFLSEKNSKSRSGCMIRLAGGAINWSTKRQGITALSTSEAETIALCKTAQMVVPERRLFAEITRSTLEAMPPTTIFEDNQAAVFTANNDGFVRSGSRHMLVKYHYTRECIADGQVRVVFMSGDAIPSDMLTKILHRPKAHALLPMFFGMTHHEMLHAASTTV